MADRKQRESLVQSKAERIVGPQVARKRKMVHKEAVSVESKMLVPALKAALSALNVPAREFAGFRKPALVELLLSKRALLTVPAADFGSANPAASKSQKRCKKTVDEEEELQDEEEDDDDDDDEEEEEEEEKEQDEEEEKEIAIDEAAVQDQELKVKSSVPKKKTNRIVLSDEEEGATRVVSLPAKISALREQMYVLKVPLCLG